MNKKQSLKTAALVCLIIAIVATVVGLAGILLFPCFNAEGGAFGSAFVDQLMNQLTMVKEAFIYLFAKDSCTNLAAVYGNGGVLIMIISIAVLVVAALTLIGIVLGIILAVKRNKGKYCGYIALMLAVAFAGVMVIANGSTYCNPLINFFKGQPAPAIQITLTTVAAVVFSAIAFIMTIVTYVLGLKYAKAPAEASEAQLIAEAQPVLAEEVTTDEIVEENVSEEVVEEETVEEVSDEILEEPEEVVEEETVVEEVVEPEEPAEEPEEEKKVEVTVNNNQAPAQQPLDTNSLATLLREVVRDIVRDEIARNNVNQPQPQPQQPQPNNSTVTGATFGGPLVVQYFNGGINGVTPTNNAPVANNPTVAPAPAPAAAPEAPAGAPKTEEVAPVEAVAPVVEEPKEAKVYERISFVERLFASEKELQDNYNEIKNEILSWGVKSRVSTSGDTFRLHKKMYVKLTIAGKSLKLYFALDPAEYESSTIPVQDASNKAAYAEIPLCFKVKSGLSMRRCKELIQATMEKDGLEQGEVMKVNWIKELKAEMKAGKKPQKSKKSEEDDD